jgi:hypothetical protein
MTRSMKGIMIASAVASLFATNSFAGDKAPTKGTKEAAAKISCGGANECKGKGACGGPGHDCAGNNECKGKGWISLTEKECKARGGTVIASMK